MSGMDRMTDDSGYEAFAAYFRKNYPGPDTIIGNPDWHAPRLYRAALDAHRRASQAAPAPQDGNKPEWLADCAVCRRVIDTREECDGGDPHGCEVGSDFWVCSPECWEAQCVGDGIPAAPAPSYGLREALERIAEEQMYRSGYDQTDISVEPVLSASEMQHIARAALTASPAQEGDLT